MRAPLGLALVKHGQKQERLLLSTRKFRGFFANFSGSFHAISMTCRSERQWAAIIMHGDLF